MEQFRSNWRGDPMLGDDAPPQPRLPTGNAADPALSDYGIIQSRELAAHLTKNTGSAMPVERMYCSPYYRCLETVQPLVNTMTEADGGKTKEVVRCEPGLVDWFGPLPFKHPQPLPAAELRDRFFPWIDAAYIPSVGGPSPEGESMAQLHARLAAVVGSIVRQCDAEGVRSVLLCTHAAPIIALGRVLTGQVPADVGAEDFGVFTCGLTTYRRRQQPPVAIDPSTIFSWDDPQKILSTQTWTHGRGVGGGWDCAVSCDCSFLSGGEERGW
ncbi:C6 zinc cluster transcription factor-like protein [Sporothrix stenoceras]|uniref:C6 zinc cluster transcription factor-like protein n=1 Tax=Sporothrix stenoceras TaxID=5173 RepID=A0ABR3ZD52_9PEZI